MGTERRFLTYQTVQRYEAALQRHAQFCRWTRVFICPCITKNTNQPNIHCPICKGRGEIYKAPGPFKIIDELVTHDENGKVFLKNKNYIDGTLVIWKTNLNGVHVPIEIDSIQPLNKDYVQLAYPWIKPYERLYANYQFDSNITINSGSGKLVRADILTIVPDSLKILFKGRIYYGSLSKVTRVYNATKDYLYTVNNYAKQFIFINDAGTNNPSESDVLELDYSYQSPYPFLVHSVSTKLRYESSYIIDQADSVIQSAYYYDIAPRDLITALSMEIPGYSIIDPTISGSIGTDIINDVFDVARVTGIVDANGNDYNINSVQLIGRNEIKWIGTKPLIKYTIQYMYNPTFVGLTTYDTSRTSENKSFVNRLNAMIKDRLTEEVTF